MRYIIYISSAAYLLDEHKLHGMLKKFRAKNLKHDITGVLLYFDESFIAVLEGDPDNVEKVFRAIEKDERHKDIIKIFDEPLHKRNFSDWSMAFLSKNPDVAEKLPGFINFDEVLHHKGRHRAVVALKTFINTHKIAVNHHTAI